MKIIERNIHGFQTQIMQMFHWIYTDCFCHQVTSIEKQILFHIKCIIFMFILFDTQHEFISENNSQLKRYTFNISLDIESLHEYKDGRCYIFRHFRTHSRLYDFSWNVIIHICGTIVFDLFYYEYVQLIIFQLNYLIYPFR